MTRFRNSLRRTAAAALLALAVSPAASAQEAPAAATAQEAPDYFSADAVLRFARALYAEGDYGRASPELLRYLFLTDSGDREVLFLAAKCDQLSGKAEKALEAFERIAADGIGDEWAARARYEAAITEALLGRHPESLARLGDGSLPTLSDAYEPLLLRGWDLLLADDWTGADEALARSPSALAADLRPLAEKAMSMPRRSPALAGILSAVLPGAGKLYTDRPTDALFSFTLVGSLAALSGFAFADEGISSVRGWTYGSLALLFHAGNVYGAVVAARQFNEAGRAGIESQAMDFYDAHLR